MKKGQSAPALLTLEETCTKLREVMAKEDARASNEPSVVISTEKCVIIDENDDDDDAQEEEYQTSSATSQEVGYSVLDHWIPSAGSYPEPFTGGIWVPFSAPEPEWPRMPSSVEPIPHVLTEGGVDELTDKIRSLIVSKRKKVTITKRVSATRAARYNLANKVLKSVRVFLPAILQPEPIDEGQEELTFAQPTELDQEQFNALVSEEDCLLYAEANGLLAAQVQIGETATETYSSNQSPEDQVEVYYDAHTFPEEMDVEQVLPVVCDQISHMTIRRPKVNPDDETEDESRSDTTYEECDDDNGSTDQGAPSLTWSQSTLSEPTSPPLLSYEELEAMRYEGWDPHSAASFEPTINAIPDPLTLEEQMPKDPAALNQIVKMTLDDLGIPYPPNIDAPFIPTIRPTFAPNPADVHLSHIYETAKLYDDQFPLPEDYHFKPFPEDYFKYHDHPAEFPGDPIMDLIHDQDLIEPEPEHTLLSDLQAAFPSMIFTEVEAPPGWYPEPSATNPDDPSDIAPDARRSAPEDVIPYIVARERDPPKPWATDEFIMQHPLLMEEFGYGHPDWNEPGWLDHLYDRDRHVVEIASQFRYPEPPAEPQPKSEPQPRRRRHRRKKVSEPKPVEATPEPPAVAEPEIDYVSLPLPEPEPMPSHEPGWLDTIRDFVCAMVNQAFDRTPEEISMLQYLNF